MSQEELEAQMSTQHKFITDPEEFVNGWLTTNDYHITGAGNFVQKNDNVALKTVFDYLWLDYKKMYRVESPRINSYYKTVYKPNSGKQKLATAIVESDMRKALDKVQNEQVVASRKAAIELVRTTGEDLTELRRWLKAVSGNESSVELAVFAHFLWSVKRKLTKQEVVYHIMPVIYGPQGGGKSKAVAALCKALAELCYHAPSVEIISDEKYQLAMERYFVMIFDEMQGAHKADIEKLKGQISATHNSVRYFHTQNVANVFQNCSFIGTTNKPINEMIYDTTGMRRFYQLNALTKADWETINSIDYVKLWQGIDETKASGYITEEADALKLYQAELETKDDIMSFIEEVNIDLSVGPYKYFPIADVYRVYKAWAILNGCIIYHKNNFSTRLSNRLNKKVVQYRVGKDRVRGIELNASCGIKTDEDNSSEVERKMKGE